jgi:hypothetical protein
MFVCNSLLWIGLTCAAFGSICEMEVNDHILPAAPLYTPRITMDTVDQEDIERTLDRQEPVLIFRTQTPLLPVVGGRVRMFRVYHSPLPTLTQPQSQISPAHSGDMDGPLLD